MGAGTSSSDVCCSSGSAGTCPAGTSSSDVRCSSGSAGGPAGTSSSDVCCSGSAGASPAGTSSSDVCCSTKETIRCPAGTSSSYLCSAATSDLCSAATSDLRSAAAVRVRAASDLRCSNSAAREEAEEVEEASIFIFILEALWIIVFVAVALFCADLSKDLLVSECLYSKALYRCTEPFSPFLISALLSV